MKERQEKLIREWIISDAPGAIERHDAFRQNTKPKAISPRRITSMSRLNRKPADGYNDIAPLMSLWAKTLTPRQRLYVENYIYKGKKNLYGGNSRELSHLRQNWEEWFWKYRLLTYTINR